MNYRRQGDIGVAEAISYYTKKGYEVFHPLTEATRVDLIVSKNNILTRVQCKTSTVENPGGSFSVSLVTSGGNTSWDGTKKYISKDEVDVVFVWCSNDSIWIIPAHAVEGMSVLSVGYKNREYHVSGPAPKSLKNYHHEHNGKVEKRCVECDVPISKNAEHCKDHAVYSRGHKIDWPPVNDVLELVEELSFRGAGRRLGVSDNAVRRYLKTNGAL